MINLQEAVYKIIHLPMINRRQAEQLVKDIYKRGFEDGRRVLVKGRTLDRLNINRLNKKTI